MPKKRPRDPYNVDVKLVEIYEDLANEKDEIRLKAARELVLRFTPDSNPTEDQIEKSLERLFRGLCSGRKAARVGFSIALTEVLSQVFSSPKGISLQGLSISRILDIWKCQSHISGTNSGQVGVHRISFFFSYLFQYLMIHCRRKETAILVGYLEQKLSSNLRCYFSPGSHRKNGPPF